ncbi:hypothetical protein F2P81_021047 [Scophthalmus maximus]|uniref:Uncharacterized protein n=1 Tax=Scophthalmus maximus TaxID=52904 RepID=A0A6A4S3U5_SCOMX|nr:hypothetical protein F2P81_021047 [Scophthalmus maximus]
MYPDEEKSFISIFVGVQRHGSPTKDGDAADERSSSSNVHLRSVGHRVNVSQRSPACGRQSQPHCLQRDTFTIKHPVPPFKVKLRTATVFIFHRAARHAIIKRTITRKVHDGESNTTVSGKSKHVYSHAYQKWLEGGALRLGSFRLFPSTLTPGPSPPLPPRLLYVWQQRPCAVAILAEHPSPPAPSQHRATAAAVRELHPEQRSPLGRTSDTAKPTATDEDPVE